MAFFSRGEVGRQDSWRYGLSHDVCGSFVISPGIKIEFEGVLVFLIVIMVCKPDSGIFSKSVIEAFEEVGFAKDIGVIGNHDGCFAEGGTSASDWIFFVEFFGWERHF